MARQNFISILLLLICFNSIQSAVIGKEVYDNEIKDSFSSNGDVFECYREKDVLNCVWQRAGKFLKFLETEGHRQVESLIKEANRNTSSGRVVDSVTSEPLEDIVTNYLYSLVLTAFGLDRARGGSEAKPLSDELKGLEVLRQLNKKGSGAMMLIGLGSLFISKMMFYLNLIRLKLQFKFFLIALIALALNIARFIMEWQQKHHHAHLAHPKIVYRDDETISGGYAGEEWKRTKEQEPWDDEDERYPYRGHEKFQQYNRLKAPLS